MKKNIYSIFIFSLLFFVFSGVASAANFKDVPKNHSSYKEIMSLSEQGVIKGYPNNLFGPNDNVKRSQAAIMIVRALKLDTSNRPNPNFSDISTTSSAYKEIATLADEGIISHENKFRPNEFLKRDEMAEILVKAFDIQTVDKTVFKDVSASHWAYSYIGALHSNTITTGYTDKTYRPNANVKRSQFAVFFYRANEKIINTPVVNVVPEILEASNFTIGSELVAAGDYLFFSDQDGIFRVNKDGQNVVQLSDDIATDLYEINGTLFYINLLDLNYIYSISTEGKNRKIFLDQYTRQLQGKGNTLYYALEDYQKNQYGIYQIDTNGKNKKVLTTNYVQSFVKTNENIYYSGGKPLHEGGTFDSIGLQKLSLKNGKTQVLNGNGYTTSSLSFTSDWIYFTEQGNLLKIKSDGTNKTTVLRNVSSFVIKNNLIYFFREQQVNAVTFEYTLHLAFLDGSNQKQILQDKMQPSLTIVDKILYYKKTDGNFYEAVID